MAKHAKKIMKSQKKLSGVRKPARKSSRIFSIYIYRVLKQVHPELGISSKAMEVMNNFMQDIFHRLSEESAGLVKFSRKSTLTSSDIQTAARLALPGELAKHAVSEGTKAVARFLASKKESVSAPMARGQPPAVAKRVQQQVEPQKQKEAPLAKRVAKEGMATSVKGPPPPVKGVPPQLAQKGGDAKNLVEAKRRQQEEAQKAKEEQERKCKEEAEAKKREAEAKKREEAESKKRQAEVKKREVEAKKRAEVESKKRKQEEAEAIKRKKQSEEAERKAAEKSKKDSENEEEEEEEPDEEDHDTRSPTPSRETQAPDSTTQTRPVEIVIPIRPEKRSSLRSYRKQQGAGQEPNVIRIEAHVLEPTPASQESVPESSQESALSYTMEPSSQGTDYSQETDDSQRTDFNDYGTQESSFTSETLEGDRQTVVTVTYTRVTATAVVTTPGGRNRSHTSEHSFAEADHNTEDTETAA